MEEAAGISKYKDRRRETENRIRHTRENLERLADVREELGKYQTVAPCEACSGYRLKPEALAVKIAGRHAGRWGVSSGGRTGA